MIQTWQIPPDLVKVFEAYRVSYLIDCLAGFLGDVTIPPYYEVSQELAGLASRLRQRELN